MHLAFLYRVANELSLPARFPACLFIVAREWSVLFGSRELVVCDLGGKWVGCGAGDGEWGMTIFV